MPPEELPFEALHPAEKEATASVTPATRENDATVQGELILLG
jgi:hypothetical protein